ncbi:MAG: DUF445 family protein [Elusimicrobiales bacterium]|nr:DUF445 family protein [Elusimicrobiales bacterium]
MKDFFENIRCKCLLSRSAEKDKEIRIFAAMEVLCIAASFFTFLWLLFILICSFFGWHQPYAAQACMTVFLSAAVGYLTNYIAIEMLFKPYKPDKKHFFSIITFSYWKQGLIPKNKHKIGIQLGEIVGQRLLNPEKLADELCNMVSSFLQKKETASWLSDNAKPLLKKYEGSITAFLLPRIEKMLSALAKKIITPDNLRIFILNDIMPYLSKESTRENISIYISQGLKQRSPYLVEMLKTELRKKSEEYLEKNLPLPGMGGIIANGLVMFIDWNYVHNQIRNKIGERSVLEMIENELMSLSDKFSVWLSGEEAAASMACFISGMHGKIDAFLHEHLEEMIESLAGNLFDSPALWNWVEKEILPAAKEKAEELIRDKGKDEILKKLNLNQRISDEIDRQDVKGFHNMINEVAAQHLGAIQVIGWILGFFIGLLQLAIR